jgi:hypothetical protein
MKNTGKLTTMKMLLKMDQAEGTNIFDPSSMPQVQPPQQQKSRFESTLKTDLVIFGPLMKA